MTDVTLLAGAREFLLALADDEHMVGARHAEWIGLGPFLEEDLAFCSIAQDELGHAIALYEVLLTDIGLDAAAGLDAFAMLRDPADYRSSHLAEAKCSEWADSIARHWLYDRAESLRWGALIGSSHADVAAVATRALAEERFHLDHVERFVARVAATPQVTAAVDRLLPLAVAAWWPPPGETEAKESGVTTRTSAELAAEWEQQMREDAARWSVVLNWPNSLHPLVLEHIDRTRRSKGFDEFHGSLTQVLRLDPDAVW